MKLVMMGIVLGVLSACATSGTEVKCDTRLSRINPVPTPSEPTVVEKGAEKLSATPQDSAASASAAPAESPATLDVATTDSDPEFPGDEP